jgi:hypothetical protein
MEIGNFQSSLNELRMRYPWPLKRPYDDLVGWPLDGGGRQLVTKLIQKKNLSLQVEIGTFLGDSAKKWLDSHPALILICVDPWEGSDYWVDYARKHNREDLANIFKEPDGIYHAFLSLMWNYRERIIPVKGYSPEKLYELHDLGVFPEIFYLDGTKTGDELDVCESLFPNAIITGDDWTWSNGEGYPIRETVKGFANKNGYLYQAFRATWLLKRPPFSLRDYVDVATYRLLDGISG